MKFGSRIVEIGLPRNILFFFQRLIRGWDDSETWSLDYSLAKLILPRLKRFREVTICTPVCFDTEKEWKETLDKMIWSFEFLASEDRWSELDGNKFDKAQEGLNLFAEHYMYLWW